MRTEKLAFISTAHLSLQTRDWLNNVDWENEGPSGGAMPFGWFIYAHDDNTSYDGAGPAHAPDGEYPADLWACFEFARARGCFHIRFDSDEDAIEGLPTYDDHPALVDADGLLVPGMVYDLVQNEDGHWYAKLPHQDNDEAQCFATHENGIAKLAAEGTPLRRVIDDLGNEVPREPAA